MNSFFEWSSKLASSYNSEEIEISVNKHVIYVLKKEISKPYL